MYFHIGCAEGGVRVCVRACAGVCVKAYKPQLVEKCLELPIWLYLSVLQCSGLTQCTHAIAVGALPGCMCLSP